MEDHLTRLECLRITAEARARAGLYDAAKILADAKDFYDWVSETISKSGSPSSRSKKSKKPA